MNLQSSHSSAASRLVKWLGYGGLIPFLGFAILAWADETRTMLWQGDLRAYGAVILSFVGALHWGLAMAPGKIAAKERCAMFAWSVVPSLLAFLALIAHSGSADILLIGGFLLHCGMDLRIAMRAVLPGWYLPLRIRLSVIAIICLATGALAPVALSA